MPPIARHQDRDRNRRDEGCGRRLGVLFSSTQGKTNNTTCFIHLQPLSLRGFRCLIAIVSPYKHQTWGPVRAYPKLYEFAMDPQIGTPHSICSWDMSQARTCTHSYTTQYFHPAPWIWETQFHLKRQLAGCLWVLIRLSLSLPPKAVLNPNLGSYQADEQGSQIGFQAFPGSFVWSKLTSLVCWERGSPTSDQHILWYLAGTALPAGWGHWASDKEVKTPPWIPDTGDPRNVVGWLREKQTPKLLGSKFIKQADSNSEDLSPTAEPRDQRGFSLYII
jgi:hypothetical protein